MAHTSYGAAVSQLQLQGMQSPISKERSKIGSYLVLGALLVVGSLILVFRNPEFSPMSSDSILSSFQTVDPSSYFLSQKNKVSASPTSRPNIIFWMADDMQMVFDDAAELPPTVQVRTAAVPNHEAIRSESGVFAKAYAVSPKCAPARFNILTMKYCSRGGNSRKNTLLDMDATTFDGRVTVDDTCRIALDQGSETLATILKANGYETIMSGKWHQMEDIHDWGLTYEQVEDRIKSTGFTRVAAAYASNVPAPDEFWKLGFEYPEEMQFSHNMEWELGAALREIDEVVALGKPFFLYLAPTAPNNYVDYYDALAKDPHLTPKGMIPDSEMYPTGMPSRQSVWERALNAANGRATKASQGTYAGHIWVDDALGAMYNHLQQLGILDNTIFVVTTDHGMTAKGHLYQGGTKVFNTMRFPEFFGNGRRMEELLMANIDLGPTVLDYLGISIPYAHDGVSFLNAIRNVGPGRDYLVTEVANDRAVIDNNKNQKFFSRSWLDTHEVADPEYYPYHTDIEQLYNLNFDPTEQRSIAYCAPQNPDIETYRHIICEHDMEMKFEGVEDSCPVVDWNRNHFLLTSCPEPIFSPSSFKSLPEVSGSTVPAITTHGALAISSAATPSRVPFQMPTTVKAPVPVPVPAPVPVPVPVPVTASTYTQPATTQYAQPATTQYSQPVTTQYAQPASTQYAQPASTQYAQPAATQYVQPATTQYAQPATTQYTQTAAQTETSNAYARDWYIFKGSDKKAYSFNPRTGEVSSSAARPTTSSQEPPQSFWFQYVSYQGIPIFFNPVTAEIKTVSSVQRGEVNAAGGPQWYQYFTVDGVPFYFNPETGATKKQDNDVMVAQPSKQQHWWQYLSSEGTPYYYNPSTGETRWEV